MPEFLPGTDLARHYYTDAVRPLLGDLPHAAARLGPGSDVLGFDTERSTDHDWGPRLELFVDNPDDHGHLTAMLRDRLPTHIRGWPTHFTPPGPGIRMMTHTDGPVDHYIQITAFAPWCRQLLGFDPADGIHTLDWLATPWQRLAEITGGAVFHDPDDNLTRVRTQLTWYPDDLWRYVLACQWQQIAQEEPFVMRAAATGDELGSRLLAARLTRQAARLLLLLSRRWPPYSKWLTAALRTDPAAPHLLRAVHTPHPRTREDALCTVYEIAATRQNELGLAVTLTPTRREFHTRGYAVIDAARFAEALRAEIRDSVLSRMPLTGSIDQFVDSTDVLIDPRLTRAIIQPTMTPL